MPREVFGVIAPHPPIIVDAVGGDRARVTQASLDAMAAASTALANWNPDVVVVMSPHSPGFADAFIVETTPQLSGSFAQFGAAKARYSYRTDTEFAHALLAQLEQRGIPAVDRALEPQLSPGTLDHGLMVPMSFLDPVGRWPVVEIALSYLPYEVHRMLGECVADVARALSRRAAFVASGDCSHRLTPDASAGYNRRAAELDATIVARVRSGDFRGLMSIDPAVVEAGGECGLRSFITLGGFAGEPVSTSVLAYEGPWGVGYLTALVGDAALRAAEIDSGAHSAGTTEVPSSDPQSDLGRAPSAPSEIVALARRTIETYVREGRIITPEPLQDPRLPAQAGVFVSLHRIGQLRGCIGTILATQPSLAEEVVHNAIEAAMHDPRFPSLAADELADLDVKVDVLHAPEQCAIGDLDPKDYGVIVTSGWRRGLLLPDLEGVEDVETQVAIAMQKAGIGPDDRCGFERFKVDRYE